MTIVKTIQRIGASAITALSLVGLATPVLAADLTLEIVNIADSSGTLRVAIYDSEDKFDSKTIYRAMVQPAKQGSVRIILGDMPAGEYGIMLYQDTNGNEKLDRNLLGIPKEPWSASLLGRSVFGPPGWNDINFTLPDAGDSIVVDMQ